MALQSSYSDKQDHIRDLKLPEIETWKNEYPEKEYTITSTTSEFTCVCPKTGLPDFATLTISYMPNKDCIELKSFKEYLLAYRDLGIFHEHVVNKLLTDLVKACQPRQMKITGVFNNRGGITTTVEANYQS